MNIIRRGKLFWFHLDAPDIDRFLLVRFFRRIGINYIPFTIRNYQRLYLREDKSKYSRLLVNYCKKNGIETYVVQEGIGSDPPTGHIPFHADNFICTQEKYQWWIDRGMPKDKIRIYNRDYLAEDCDGIVFMHPFYTNEDFMDAFFTNEHNERIMEVITRFRNERVVFKLHPKDQNLITPFIPRQRIVSGDTLSLIRKYKKIYVFKDSSIISDCEMVGREYEIV